MKNNLKKIAIIFLTSVKTILDVIETLFPTICLIWAILELYQGDYVMSGIVLVFYTVTKTADIVTQHTKHTGTLTRIMEMQACSNVLWSKKIQKLEKKPENIENVRV